MEKIRILNKLTGEVNHYELNVNDPDALAQAEIDAKAFIEEVESFRKKIKAHTDTYMALNDYKPVEVKGGDYQWVHRAPVTKIYSFITARQFIDEDTLIASGAIKLQTGVLKKLAAEMVEEGTQPAGFWEELEATAESKASKPYVMLERLK
jgi:hypothetical protein